MTNQLSKSPKPKISVALATYNEEENIGPCLASVRDWVDEVIVVDGTSKDKTVEIAKKYGAKVLITTNKPIFHINKQIAIDKCGGDWILQLDADERVTPELAGEIRQVVSGGKVKKLSHGTTAYYIPRKNYFLGKWMRKGGQYPDYVIRFFKKGQAYLPCKSVHEQMKVKGNIGYLEGHLLHYTAPNFSHYLAHANRFTSLTAQGMMDNRLPIGPLTAFRYFWLKPLATFVSLYFRHKGFLDGWRGFIFAFFSGVHFAIAYYKYVKWKVQKREIDLEKDWS